VGQSQQPALGYRLQPEPQRIQSKGGESDWRAQGDARRCLQDDQRHRGYKRFMPYTGEARVLSRETNSMVVYERLVMPLVSDRDFAIRMHNETRCSADGGTSYVTRWQCANEFAPPKQRGVIRVKTNEGSWTLEPVEDGRFTRVTYWVYTDPGGKIPVSILNSANTSAIPKVFAAVEKEAGRR
jgi:hypothetical protein